MFYKNALIVSFVMMLTSSAFASHPDGFAISGELYESVSSPLQTYSYSAKFYLNHVDKTTIEYRGIVRLKYDDGHGPTQKNYTGYFKLYRDLATDDILGGRIEITLYKTWDKLVVAVLPVNISTTPKIGDVLTSNNGKLRYFVDPICAPTQVTCSYDGVLGKVTGNLLIENVIE